MKVKYFAYIRDYTKSKECDEEYKSNIKDLLYNLSNKYGKDFKNKVLTDDGENLGKEIIILVNGRNVVHIDGINTKLVSSDVIQIFPVIAGG